MGLISRVSSRTYRDYKMGKAKKTRQAKLFSVKSNAVKREREEKNRGKPEHQHLKIGQENIKKQDPHKLKVKHVTQASSAMFFKYNTLALKLLKDPRFEKLNCVHNGTYADDCLVRRIEQHKCYIVATCDRDLKRRIRKVPGVPIMYVSQHKYVIE